LSRGGRRSLFSVSVTTRVATAGFVVQGGRMDVAFVLVHSPSVGPLTWAPIAQRMEASGIRVIVPSLVGVADASPPFWWPVVRAVRDAIEQIPQGQPIVLVAHSNAGLFVPVIVDASPRRVAGCLFVDAALPSLAGPTPVAPAELLDFLRPKVAEGRLPQWTEWWDESDVAPMFPDAKTRSAVSPEQPRLPLSYYEELVPTPAGWNDRPCGYLLFGPPYEPLAKEATERGWAVEHVPGRHLHQLVDPEAVTARIVAMAAAWH
jgi:pimeloyl-ACP methyl ester carboxylesterase